jgi:hypothetical protein
MLLLSVATSLFLLLQSTATGSIEGTVLGSTSGKPIPFAKVIATRLSKDSAQIPPALADQNGRFLFRPLASGTYFLRAAADGYSEESSTTTQVVLSPGQMVQRVQFRLLPGGTISGRVSGSADQPLPHMQVSLLRVAYTIEASRLISQVVSAETDDQGLYRLPLAPPGRYFLVADSPRSSNAGSLLNIVPSDSKYSQTFYPSARNLAASSPIELRPAADLKNLDFHLIEQPAYHIRGRVIDVDGNPASGRLPISLVGSESDITALGRSVFPTPVFTDALGRFDITRVFPGSYIVGAMSPVSGAVPAGATPAFRSASTSADVHDSDVDDVVIRFAPPVSVSARIRVEGEGPAIDISRLFIHLRPENLWVNSRTVTGRKTADGVLEFTELGAGKYQVEIVPTVLYLKSVRFNGQDALNNPLSLTESTREPIDIVVGKDGGLITATIQDVSPPASGLTVVLVPDQRDRYYLYKYSTTGPTGAAGFRNVAPGSYKIFAFQKIEQNSWFDPLILREYEKLGSPVKIAASSRVMVQLKLIRP